MNYLRLLLIQLPLKAEEHLEKLAFGGQAGLLHVGLCPWHSSGEERVSPNIFFMRTSGWEGWGLVGLVPLAIVNLPFEAATTEARNIVFLGGAISVRRGFLRKGTVSVLRKRREL